MEKSKAKGFFYGIATSVTFGLIPLFTLPLMQKGLSSDSILFYRFLTASLALAAMLKLKGEPFAIGRRDVPVILLLAVFYAASSMFLLYGYEFMGAGIATTLHFTYPVFVTLLMLLIFRESVSWLTWLAIVLAVGGVARLSLHGSELTLAPLGVVIVLLSAVGYASYIIAVNKSRVRDMNSRKLAFYVFVFTTLIFGIKNLADGGIQPVPDAGAAACIVLHFVDGVARIAGPAHVGLLPGGVAGKIALQVVHPLPQDEHAVKGVLSPGFGPLQHLLGELEELAVVLVQLLNTHQIVFVPCKHSSPILCC